MPCTKLKLKVIVQWHRFLILEYNFSLKLRKESEKIIVKQFYILPSGITSPYSLLTQMSLLIQPSTNKCPQRQASRVSPEDIHLNLRWIKKKHVKILSIFLFIIICYKYYLSAKILRSFSKYFITIFSIKEPLIKIYVLRYKFYHCLEFGNWFNYCGYHPFH